MSKEIRGNPKKYVLLDKIKSNIEKYNGQLCVFNVDAMTVNDFINFKKKIPNNIKLLTVPTKIGLLALKDKIDVSSANIKGKICFAFAEDALQCVELTELVPKSIRSEFVFTGITWNSTLDTSKNFTEFLQSNGIYSQQHIKERAIFNLLSPYMQFRNLIKIRIDML